VSTNHRSSRIYGSVYEGDIKNTRHGSVDSKTVMGEVLKKVKVNKGHKGGKKNFVAL
jgi:hypothetical protein